MPDNKQIIFVPVDPEAYGLGMLLGCLIRFWPVVVIILVAAMGIGVVSILGQEGKRLLNAPVTQAVETQNAIAAENQAYVQATAGTIYQDQVNAVIDKLRQQEIIQLNEQIPGGDSQDYLFIIVDHVKFENDNILVHLISQTPRYLSAPLGSSIICGSKSVSKTGEIVEQQYNNLNFNSFRGYLIFSFSVIEPNSECFFWYGSHGSFSKILLFNTQNIVSGNNPLDPITIKSGVACPQNSVCRFPVSSQAREQGEQPNSSMQLISMESNSGQDSLRLYLMINVDQGAGGFRLDKPEYVSLNISGVPYYPTAWGGLFGSDDSIDDMYWQGDSPSKLGWIEFRGVWSQISQGTCFDFLYGQFYTFSNICN